jgi:hypothetical protein
MPIGIFRAVYQSKSKVIRMNKGLNHDDKDRTVRKTLKQRLDYASKRKELLIVANIKKHIWNCYLSTFKQFSRYFSLLKITGAIFWWSWI